MNPETEGVAEIIIGKQRNGPTGTAKLAFLKEYTRFENLDAADASERVIRPTVARVDLDALAAQLPRDRGAPRARRAAAGPRPPGIIAVVKANAYGHGARAVARALEAAGRRDARVRRHRRRRRAAAGGRAARRSSSSARSSVSDLDGIFDARPDADDLDARRRRAPCRPRPRARGVALALSPQDRHRHEPARLPPRQPRAHAAGGRSASPHLRIDAVYTHFATADEPDHPLFGEQRARFDGVDRAPVGARHRRPRVRHAANSAALLRDERVWFDFVRPGPAALRRRAAAARDDASPLRPALSLHSRIVAVKGMRPGEGAGYGVAMTATEPADDRRRAGRLRRRPRPRLAGRGVVLVRGRRVPIVGSVCMDMMMIDVTGLDVAPGDEVVIVGAQGDERDRRARDGRVDRHDSVRSSCAASAARIERVYRRAIVGVDSRRVRMLQAESCEPTSMKPKTVFACQECGAQSPKWLGRCPECGAWNSMVEERPVPAAVPAGSTEKRYALAGAAGRAALCRHRHGRRRAAVDRHRRVRSRARRRRRAGLARAARRRAGHRQVDAAAAGGGALRARTSDRCSTARARSPSIRSSCAASGSASSGAPLYLLAETCLERILEEVARLQPALLIVDSIQTVFSLKFQSAPGSVGQVREAATQLLFAAKGQNIPTFLVGHVTKDGSLAGPKALEHIVDTVLYFEGERHHAHRVVRAVKNRFGAVSELGVFEMTGAGLQAGAEPVAAVPRRAAGQRAGFGGAVLRSRARARSSSRCRRS